LFNSAISSDRVGYLICCLSLVDVGNFMKIYNTKLDKYGYPVDIYVFLCDTKFMSSGIKEEAILVMKIWNFIGKIVNKFKK